MLVQDKIIKEENAIIRVCDSCSISMSTELYILKQGFCVTLSHVCKKCGLELKDDCELKNYNYQLLSKK